VSSGPPVVLSVGGTDSGGGAGLAADLRACAVLGVFATSAVTVVTAQNTVEFGPAVPVPADVVAAQMSAVLHDLGPLGVKTGMLWSPGTAATVAAVLDEYPGTVRVVDPVLVDGTGRRIMAIELDDVYRTRLIPGARFVTPNRREAELLTGLDVVDVAGAAAAGRRLIDLGAEAVVVTSVPGSAPGLIADVIVGEAGEQIMEGPEITTGHTRGSGDTFSAALLCQLVGGSAGEAVGRAREFTRAALRRGEHAPLGRGRGPVVARCGD